MGPLELQLYRELAIQMVRQCAEQARPAGDEWPMELDRYRLWFDLTHEDWASTPRAELGGLTPGETIRDEHARLGRRSAEPGAAWHVELYTDLPQVQDSGERIGAVDHELVSPGVTDPPTLLERGGERGELTPEASAPASPADAARWRAFCDRFLAGWLEA